MDSFSGHLMTDWLTS